MSIVTKSGIEFTDEMLDQIASAFEQGEWPGTKTEICPHGTVFSLALTETPGDAPPSRQPGGEPLRRHPEMPARRDSPDRIDGFARFGLIRRNRNENAVDGYDSYCIFSRITLDYAI